MRGLRLLSVVVLLAVTATFPARSAPVIRIAPAGLGPLSSDNVSPVLTIPDVGMTGGRFAGGFFFATISSPVFFEPGPNSGLRIYDVNDPEAPLLIGALPLPHAENEDVDISVSRQLALISMDTLDEGKADSVVVGGPDTVAYKPGDKLFVVDWSFPHVPELKGVLTLPAAVGNGAGGPGHITNCIADCKRYAWVTGARDGSIFVIDLENPADPKIATTIPASVSKSFGLVHDVNVDQYGYVWITGSGGTVMLDAKNPLKPKALKWIASYQSRAYIQFIHHNSLRLDKSTVLVTEEDWLQPQCHRDQTYSVPGVETLPAGEQGGFQTWSIDARKTGEGSVRFMDQWMTELEQYGAGSNPINIVCSSHWFTYNSRKIVAVAWYNQGVRFLDVSNPKDIRQVGYWMGPASTASGAYFAPGRDDIVYIADYSRGLDIVKLSNGGASSKTVTAPIRAEWLGAAVEQVAFEPHPAFGWACPRPRIP